MEFISIKELSTVVRGSSPRPKGDPRYYGGNIPRLMVTDVTRDGMYVTPKIDFLTEEGAKKSRPMLKGDLIIAVSGNPGEPSILAVDACIHDGFVGLRNLDSTKVYTPYLFRFFKFNKLKNKSQAVGAIYKNLNTDQIKALKIPLPKLETQKRIAAILDEADKIRQLNKELIIKYDTLKQSLFLEMFGDPVTNPKGWKKIAFGDYITVLTDYHSNGSYKTLSEHVTLKNESDYALMVRTTDLEKNNFIDDVKYIDEHAYNHLKKSKVFGGEIIINKIGSAGKVYRMPELNRPVSLGMNAFLLRFNDSINQVFLYFQLMSKYGEREIQKRVKGAVTKTIRKDAVREIPIVSPPIELQNKFAERVQIIESQKQQAQEALQKSEDLFNSLLQKAFKGELVKE
ncbi:MAG: restriction endonuclease subunit S [Polaribacter sp.]|uniref:restriction endonuclease subunit S n=1 Tax=Polaribacter sp. TaxID=1920175 RepID=UPI003EF1FFC9